MRRLVVVAALLLAGCSSVPGETMPPLTPPPTSDAAPTPIGPPAAGPDSSGTPRQPASQHGSPVALRPELLDAIVADLGARGHDASDLVVVSALAVTWNDGSWGCPEPDVLYTQALVPGLHVIVDAGGVQYDYRFGQGTRPRLCLPLPLR